MQQLQTETYHSCWLNYGQGGTKFTRLLATFIIAQAVVTQPYHLGENGTFDTDSKLVGIDNRCSTCISHNRADFPGKLTKCARPIKGFGGTKYFEVWTGTLIWRWDDDHGKQHSLPSPSPTISLLVRCVSSAHNIGCKPEVVKITGLVLVKQQQHSTLRSSGMVGRPSALYLLTEKGIMWQPFACHQGIKPTMLTALKLAIAAHQRERVTQLQ